MKKTIALLLLLSTLLCLFAACKEEVKKPTSTVGGDETNAPNEEELSDNLPDKNMDNFEFRIFTNHPERMTWADVIIAPDDYTGEEIYDTMFERNSYLSERFNCEFTVTQGSPTALNQAAQIQNLAMSGDSATAPQMVMHYDKWVLNSAEYFLDWNDVPYISIGEEYWNPGVSSLFNVRGKQLALSGSFHLGMVTSTMMYLFNKEIYDQYYGDVSTMYGYVTDGEWTLEKLYELALGVVDNSDGTWEDSDQVGIAGHNKSLYTSLMVGCDVSFVEIDEEGMIFFSLPNDSYAKDKLQKILQLAQDNDVFVCKSTDVHNDDGVNRFENGISLFYVHALSSVPRIRASMEAEFGILPLPKYDTDQKQYRNLSKGGELACLMVTAKQDDFENIGILMEALSFYSQQHLMPVYQDKMLKTRFASDEDSRAMVELIFNTTVAEYAANVFEDIITVPIIQAVYMPKKDVIASTLSGMTSVRNEIAKLLQNIK